MDFSKQSQAFHDLFTLDEINLLRQDQCHRPVTLWNEKLQQADKSLDYHLPQSVVRRVIKPKLDSIIGADHEFSMGCYMQALKPLPTHIDNYASMTRHHGFSYARQYQCSVLIPLAEDPEFRTVIFDVLSEDDLGMGQPLPAQFLTGSNDLDLTWFSHVPEAARCQIPQLPLQMIYQWKLGSMVIWPRTALHTSTDFGKFGLQKKWVIIFIA